MSWFTSGALRGVLRMIFVIAICTLPLWGQNQRGGPMQMVQSGNVNRASVAQLTAPDEILANDNRTPGGKVESGVVTLSLEIRTGIWHAEAEDGPRLYVQAFGETGKPAQIPGPLLRVVTGTMVHVAIANRLKRPATVFGFVRRPASSDPGIEIAPGQTRDISFAAGAPGTYFYWARTVTEPEKSRFVGDQPFALPFKADAQLNGAFIVDAAGPVPPDRIFVIDAMQVDPDVLHHLFNVWTINGKSYPFTEPLRYSMGDRVRWRIINASLMDHAMHLHGAFYRVLSLGDVDRDTQYGPGEQQTVVTQDLLAGGTMVVEWTPSHPGRWLFHCHYVGHTFTDGRVPIYGRRIAAVHSAPERVAGTPLPADPPSTMPDMAGLVLGINVLPKAAAPPERVTRKPRRLELVLQPDSSGGKSKLVACSIREGNQVITSHNKSAGPPLVLMRGELVEITVVNQLDGPTTVHWHGMQLESYYDGVMGGGLGDQVTPAIAPGDSFVARFTPTRAGTFIYHAHGSDPWQLAQGVFGAMIVLSPGQTYDPDHEVLMVIGASNLGFGPAPSADGPGMTVNGSETISDISLQHGIDYRVRVVNIAPSLETDIRLGSPQNPVTWREIAKDGTEVPPRLAKSGNAFVHIVSRETYDFELRVDRPASIPVEVKNWIYKTKLTGEITVH